jgi:hypothetical protein
MDVFRSKMTDVVLEILKKKNILHVKVPNNNTPFSAIRLLSEPLGKKHNEGGIFRMVRINNQRGSRQTRLLKWDKKNYRL